MKLRKYNCKELFVRITTSRSNFLAQKFFSDQTLKGAAKEWEKGAPVEIMQYTRSRQRSDYHVHNHLRLVGKDVRFVMTWATPAITAARSAFPPFAEDVHQWIRRFFKPQYYQVRCSGHFLFPRSRYESSLGLPLPLWLLRRRSGRRQILGIRASVDMKGAEEASVVSDLHEKHIFVSVLAEYRLRLSALNPQVILESMAPVAFDLVERKN